MSRNKWKFAEPDPGQPSPEKIERGGMLFVSGFGLLLLIGGLFFVWAIGAFDEEAFFGYNVHHASGDHHKTERTILGLLHLPWVAGALMLIASVRYFLRNRKKDR